MLNYHLPWIVHRILRQKHCQLYKKQTKKVVVISVETVAGVAVMR